MKINIPIKKVPPWVVCGVLIAMAAGSAQAAAQVQAKLINRPVTPGDKTVYSLPAALETSGGLSTVGVGTPLYLEVLVTNTVPLSHITSITWALTNTPIGSVATFTASPLLTNMPVYEPSERYLYNVGARQVLRLDLVGQYTIIATVSTTSEGTNTMTLTITAATYMGMNTCALCHSGGTISEDMFTTWQGTGHAMICSNGISGYLGHYSQSCLQCHTVGYDTNTNANNGNFYNVMQQTGWIFPPVQTPTNWAAMPASLQNLANIQCENCHGPGSQHAYALGNTNLITRTVLSGDCNQCHDAPTHHIKGTEWYVSKHAGVDSAARVPSGPNRPLCVGCHTADGFIDRMNHLGSTNSYTTNTMYAAIGCQTCHEPHGKTIPDDNPHLLRALGSYTMPDGFVVTNAGFGAICLECHHNRNGSVTNMLAKYPLGQPTWAGGSSFGTHDGPQGDMIFGINAVTYGQNIPSSAHRYALTNVCVDCHMQTVNLGDPAFLHAGGHTFGMSYPVVTGGVTNVVAKTDVCAQCHGAKSSFNFAVSDYNGDGVIEGVQTEIQHLLDKLSTLLPNSSGVVDGTVKSSLTFRTNWTQAQLQAGYNWQYVNNDGSRGVHNAPFAAGILKASIGNLTGISVPGGLPDWWVVQYFGSTTNTLADPNACPAGDGVPNWVKYALGLNPLIPGTTNAVGGIVWADGTQLAGNFPGNTVAIFTAAEVAFNTEVGKTYWIESIGSLSEGWQTIVGPIPGTGTAYSYVTPTRRNVQQYFRVVHSP
jgi:hypothetical protein